MNALGWVGWFLAVASVVLALIEAERARRADVREADALGRVTREHEYAERLERQIEKLSLMLNHAEATTADLRKRDATTSAMVDGQAVAIGQYAESNTQMLKSVERMITIVSDMKRVGFGIIEPELMASRNDEPMSTTETDEQMVEKYADRFGAADDD